MPYVRRDIPSCHFDRSGEYGVRGRRRMDCIARLGNGRASRESASQISYHFRLWHAITHSGFISSQTVINSVLYIGVTNSLSRRTWQHREGTGAAFPAAYRCTKLIYYEHYRDVRDAIARETQLKKWSRAKKVELINRLNPRWMDIGDQMFGE